MDSKVNSVGKSVPCYFCNKIFDEKYLQDHIIQCGSVLEPCPKKCGVYVQRSTKEKHIMECRHKKLRQNKSSEVITTATPANNNLIENLEKQMLVLRTALAEEKRCRQESQNELQKLYKHLKQSEERHKMLNSSVDQLKLNYYDNSNKTKSNTTQNLLEIEKINLQYQVIDNWRKHIDTNVDNLKKRLTENENKFLESEYLTRNQENRLELLDRLEMEINMLHQKINDHHFNYQDELMNFKDYFMEKVTGMEKDLGDQTEFLRKLNENHSLNDLKIKYQSILFDTKSVSNIANETAERLESQSNELKKIKNDLEQLKLDVNALKESITMNGLSGTTPVGRVLWKIQDFSNKMDKAKTNNTILRSPIFSSSLNGYKLRLEVYLNGIKKWKGRHIIISLQVLKGEFDALLTWPCNIEAKLLLRDQNGPQSKNFAKYINAKRFYGEEENEDPNESSSQYIFITHATLEKQNYIKDNTLFFEIIVTSDHLATNKTVA